MIERLIPRVVAGALAVLGVQYAAPRHPWDCGSDGRLLDEPPSEALARKLYDRLLIPYTVTRRPYTWGFCRHAPGGCRVRLQVLTSMVFDVAELHGVDPYVMAAQIWHETRWNPWAQGGGGEVGLLQLHPYRRAVRELRLFWDKRYQQECQGRVDACQWDVLVLGAAIYRKALESCGQSPLDALTAYNSGRCGDSRYARRVLKTAEELRP